MAARGYWQAYQAVQKSVGRVLHGENAGQVADEDHGTWYRRNQEDLASTENPRAALRPTVELVPSPPEPGFRD